MAAQQSITNVGSGADHVEQDSSVADHLARFAFTTHLSELPVAVVEKAKLHILDSLGIALASRQQDFGRAALSMASATSGQGRSTVIGDASDPVDARTAALANGTLIHGLDFDDTHLGAVLHPSCVALPATLATAEDVGASGAELLRAYVVASEVAVRLGMAGAGSFHEFGFHPTSVAGVFGAALGVGLLHDLDTDALAHAQGVAGSLAGGTLQFLDSGAWTKRLHAGWAAAGAIDAVRFVANGFTGPRFVYEGDFGLYRTFARVGAPTTDPLDGLGTRWRFLDTAIKPFPACQFTHGTIEAALDLAQEVGDTEQIVGIASAIPAEGMPVVAEPIESKRRPTSVYEAQFSVPHVVAASLVQRRFGLGETEASVRDDPEVRRLRELVRCEPELHSSFPDHYSGWVRVTLRDGREFTQHVRENLGSSSKPMTGPELMEKFSLNVAGSLSDEQVAHVRGCIMDIEQLKDLGELAQALAGR